MIDLEKRMNGCGCDRSNVDRSNADISFAMARAVFYGYADEMLRVFDRAMDMIVANTNL